MRTRCALTNYQHTFSPSQHTDTHTHTHTHTRTDTDTHTRTDTDTHTRTHTHTVRRPDAFICALSLLLSIFSLCLLSVFSQVRCECHVHGEDGEDGPLVRPRARDGLPGCQVRREKERKRREKDRRDKNIFTESNSSRLQCTKHAHTRTPTHSHSGSHTHVGNDLSLH